MASKFKKAESQQGYLKLALYGKTGSGKTLTALLIADGIAKGTGKRIAYIDTEYGTDLYTKSIPERIVHPEGFDFDRIVTRSISEAIEAIESIDPEEYCVLIIDSVTHFWEAARAAYNGKTTGAGTIPIQAWGAIKKPYKKLMTLFLDGRFHAILCGREGVVMEQDEDGEMKITGTKLKAEGETPYEPHILARMTPERDEKGGYVIRIFFEKDRSGIFTGKTFDWPNYKTIEPVMGYLTGGSHGQIGSPESSAEKDVAAQEAERDKTERERKELFEQIRAALLSSSTLQKLQTAWSLTTGKKTKLGDELHSQLLSIKDARKAELLEVA